MSDFFNKLLDKVKSMTETSSKKKEAENIPENDKSKSSSQNNTITFVMYVLMLLVGYKLYYFN